jgi:hypothetical protein
MSEKPISPPRQRMIEDMNLRNSALIADSEKS